jgi:agmatine/peptidylarginine deiminase
MLTWPHRTTDWQPYINEVIPCFTAIAHAVARREKLLIACASAGDAKTALGNIDESRIIFREIPSNDTWSRDHGPISVRLNGHPYIYDFTFNGWGLKFPADCDNQITKRLFDSKAFSADTVYQPMPDTVLEGGSIESDGAGTILTTARCLLSKNRNGYRNRTAAAEYFRIIFGTKRILWLNNGYLAGDDTDGHIDTLARFCDLRTIAYVQCTDKTDDHFQELLLMERELQKFKTPDGKPYRLIPLPMAKAIYEDGERLPATYANFLIINEAVLAPIYGSPLDELACQQLQQAFPDREIIGIDCRPLIRQRGSLHCLTMQLPAGFL